MVTTRAARTKRPPPVPPAARARAAAAWCGDEKAPANTKSQVAFQLPAPVVGDTVVVKGSWLTDKAYVKSGVAEINAYDRDKGTKLWTVPLA